MPEPWWWDNGEKTFQVGTDAVGAAKEAMALVAEEGLLDPKIRLMANRIAASRGLGTRGKGEEPGGQQPDRDRGRRGRAGTGRGRTGRAKDGALEEER